jgi:ketosteroid isomerase-like protein
MSRENVEVVRRQGEAYARGDWEEAMSLFDPDAVLDISRYSAGGGVFHGHEGVRAGFREWIGSWEDYRYELLDVIDAGDDKVVLTSRQSGRGRGSGVEVEVANAVVNTLRNGKVIRMDVYPTHAEAFEAAGLSE